MPNGDEAQQDSSRDASILSTFLAKALMTGAVLIGAGIVGAEGRKLIVPDHQEAKEALRSILKDADKTDRLIKAITNDPVITDELVNDPHVMKNLTKLANAMIENSRGNLTRGPRAKKWAEEQELNPVQRQLLEVLFPHLRLEPPKPQPPERSF